MPSTVNSATRFDEPITERRLRPRAGATEPAEKDPISLEERARDPSTRSSGAPARSRPDRSSPRRCRARRSARRRSRPASARSPRTPAATSFSTSGWLAWGSAAGDEIGELDARAVADERAHVGLRLLERRVGREAVVEVQREAIGHDVAPATAVARSVTVVTRAVEEAVDERARSGASTASSVEERRPPS